MRYLVVFALLTVVVACTAAYAADTTQPTINSVTATPARVAAGDTLHITANVTDDVAVGSVTANSVELTNTAGAAWEGDILADPALGTHSVAVVATDTSGNSRADTSAGYATVRLLGMANERVYDAGVSSFTTTSLFKFWGKATVLNANSFQLDDGSQFRTTVNTTGHDVCNGDFVVARGVLDNSSNPALLNSAQYYIAEAAPRSPMNIYDMTVGKDLELVVSSGRLVNPAPAGNLVVTLTSQDPSKVLLSTVQTAPGFAQITRTVPAGSTIIPDFYVQALDKTGSVQVLATAPGCLGKLFTVTLAPSGFVIGAPALINTTTFNPNTDVGVYSAQLNPATMAVATYQPLRGGLTVPVSVTSSDTAVGTITVSPVVFTGGAGTKKTYFDPEGSGTTTVAVVTPSGFDTASNKAQITATVTAPNITIPTPNVGKDLQQAGSITLGDVPPVQTDVIVSVADPSKALVSKAAATAGGPSVTFSGVTTASVGTIYVQGLAVGTTTLSVSAAGYNTATSTITVAPSGFAIYTPGSISTTTLASNTAFEVYPARLNPSTLAYSAQQALRPGVTASVTVTSSDTNVGTITVSPLAFAGGDNSKSTAFDPLNAGSTTITVEVPAGWSTPSNKRQITATVTAPDINLSSPTVGRHMQRYQNVTLQSAPPAATDVTITSLDPSKVLLSKTATGAGSASVTYSGVTTTTVGSLYTQGVALGTATVSASATGYNTKNVTATVDPSGFAIRLPGSINTTSYSTNTNITVEVARLNPTTLGWEEYGTLRAGASASVSVSSSNTGVGTITASPLSFTGNEGSKVAQFDPAAAGTSVVSIDTPAGFHTPSFNQSINATVSTPVINMADMSVGKDLQNMLVASLQAAPPSAVDVTITSGDASKVLLSKTSTGAGSNSITYTGITGTAVGTFYVQGIGLGTASLTAAATGYDTRIANVTVNPSGFVVRSPASITTTAGATNTSLSIDSAMLDSTYLNWLDYQSLRAGLSVDVSVTSSNTVVGVITASPLTFTGGGSNKTTQFDPLAAGTSTISVEVPAGWSTPSNKRQITATVNP